MRQLLVVGLISIPLTAAGVLVSACEKKDPMTSSPKPPANNSDGTESKEAPTDNPTEAPAASRPTPAGLISVADEEVHVGRYTRNEPLSVMHPSEYCLEDGRLWKGANFRLGHINVFGVDKEIEAIQGSNLVAIFGEKKQNLDSKVETTGPCPTPYEPIHVQMRSDWAAPEGGPNTTHAKLQEHPFIEGRRVQVVQMSEMLEGDEQTARFRLRNPFTQNFSGLSIEAHYEGGRGKPMPTMVKQVLALEPGEWTELSLPRKLEGDQPRTKAGSGLHGLRIQGQLGKAELNIEIFVPHR